MKRFVFVCVLFLSVFVGRLHAQLKPRMVVLTDVSTWETDDSESLVRLFAHADLLEIEGLIFTTGWSLDNTRDEFVNLIYERIDAYEKDLPNLRRRSGQNEQLKNESRQEIGYWPSPNYLRDRTAFGSTKRGSQFVGESNASPGSEMIIKLADESDDRPLWISVWGGGNTLAQAVWQVKKDRTSEQLKSFLNKLRVYTITDQDREQKTPYSDSSHHWLRRDFEQDLFFIWDECAWKCQNGTGKKNWKEYETHIQDHGFLGKLYPKYKYGVEGDTPAFLHLLPIGLNDPSIPTHGGWGGYAAWGLSEDGQTSCYTNHSGKSKAACSSLENRFYQATFNNFAARMDWAKNGVGNRNPKVAIGDDKSIELLRMQAERGSKITLDASQSSDPDDDKLTFQWWILATAGTCTEEVRILSGDSAVTQFMVPADPVGKTFHVICEVTDDGTHNLSGYRRIIFEITE